jgi:SAM-dependent methyltransferase
VPWHRTLVPRDNAPVLDYYQRGGEADRLAEGAGRLEYLRTWDLLTRELPAPPATVLDVGGATGAYAGPLADAGYAVHVVDPVDSHVTAARALPGVTAALGDARALDHPDASADAVLLLGPLYHLTERSDRVRAWREAARVVRRGGVVLAATISRYASMLDAFVQGYGPDDRFVPIMRHGLATGQHRNPDAVPRWFTTAYFHRPEEIPGEVADAGLRLDRMALIEGPLWMMGSLPGYLADPVRTRYLLDMLREVESEPSLLGSGSHVMTIARRPTG